MKLVYKPLAIDDIKRTADYIETVLKNPNAASKLKTKILQGASLLKENPYMVTSLKSKYEDLNTEIRFIVINKQLVFYKVNDEVIEIIRVLDGRTDYLTHLFDITE